MRALMTRKSCAVGMRNAILGNHLKPIRVQLYYNIRAWPSLGIARIQGVLSIQPKFPKFSKRGHMVRKFSEKGCRKSGSRWISEKRTIQPKILGWKSNGTEISRKRYSKIWVHLKRLSSFSEIMEIRKFFYSASSFSRDHSELDISRKNDGQRYSEMETL